ncbi:MAG: hypothetical protein RL043_1010 [Pseudomonadota bacterium]|jgi:hypothetical protein
MVSSVDAVVVQQSASHSFTQLRTVGNAERANHRTQTLHFFDLWTEVCVASALLIRRSLVRAQVGEPNSKSPENLLGFFMLTCFLFS